MQKASLLTYEMFSLLYIYLTVVNNIFQYLFRYILFPKLVQACSIGYEPIHRVPELVQACCIGSRPIHMIPKLVQACTNLKRDSYMSPLQFIILLVRCLANTP